MKAIVERLDGTKFEVTDLPDDFRATEYFSTPLPPSTGTAFTAGGESIRCECRKVLSGTAFFRELG